MDENLGSKMGQNGEQVLLESNFLGLKFWGANFGGADFLGEEFVRVNFRSGKKRVLGSKNVLGANFIFNGFKVIERT